MCCNHAQSGIPSGKWDGKENKHRWPSLTGRVILCPWVRASMQKPVFAFSTASLIHPQMCERFQTQPFPCLGLKPRHVWWGALNRCPAGCVGLLVRGEMVLFCSESCLFVFLNPVTAELSQCISLNSMFIEESDRECQGGKTLNVLQHQDTSLKCYWVRH